MYVYVEIAYIVLCAVVLYLQQLCLDFFFINDITKHK